MGTFLILIHQDKSFKKKIVIYLLGHLSTLLVMYLKIDKILGTISI